MNVSASSLPVHSSQLSTKEGGAVSWGAVVAGAVGAAAFSLILILLGTGLGLTMVSPWSHEGISAASASISTIAWITVVQILASVLGGYLAGRLRHRWLSVHMHEVYFRDTAHGFLAWAVATLLMATLLSSAIGTAVSTGVKTGAAVVGSTGDLQGYFVDTLFRPGATPSALTAPGALVTRPSHDAEVNRVFANGLKTGSLPAADSQYLAQLISATTGIPQADAQQRATETFSQFQQTTRQAEVKAKEAADAARKASAYLALWLVISLLLGAFVASWAATFGGRLRDSSVLVNR